MGFIERLRQDIANEAQRAEQEAEAKRLKQEAIEKARLQAEATENERREVRRKLAEAFHEESGVGLVVEDLIKFLEAPIGYTRTYSFYDGQSVEGNLEPTRRGRRDLSGGSVSQEDPDSIMDIASWDVTKQGNTFNSRNRSRYSGWEEYFAEKYLAAEICPSGLIIFHGGWLGSTKVPLSEWRTNNKETIFDKALERAFKNPGTHRFSIYHPHVDQPPGLG